MRLKSQGKDKDRATKTKSYAMDITGTFPNAGSSLYSQSHETKGDAGATKVNDLILPFRHIQMFSKIG